MVKVEQIYERYSFPNAWAKAVSLVIREGEKIVFGGKIKDKEQYERKIAKDMDLTIVMEGNAIKEALQMKLHPQFPTKEMHIKEYMKEWERGYNASRFAYTYEDRIENYPKPITRLLSESHFCNKHQMLDLCESGTTIDQWKLAREDLKNQIEYGISSNRNVIVTGIPFIDRFEIPDSPPCLREIWIRHEGNHEVSIKTTWRSRDLYTGWMPNVICLLNTVNREVVLPNNCEIIQYVDSNRSLHIYKGDWEDAKNIKLISVNPQMIGR